MSIILFSFRPLSLVPAMATDLKESLTDSAARRAMLKYRKAGLKLSYLKENYCTQSKAFERTRGSGVAAATFEKRGMGGTRYCTITAITGTSLSRTCVFSHLFDWSQPPEAPYVVQCSCTLKKAIALPKPRYHSCILIKYIRCSSRGSGHNQVQAHKTVHNAIV